MTEYDTATQADELMPSYEEILEEYRRRQMIEHLTGPMISLVLHVVVLVACALLLVGKDIRSTAELEFTSREMELNPLDKDIVDKLEELVDDVIDDVVPKTEKPNIKPEEVSVADSRDFSEALAATDMDMDLSSLLEVRTNASPLTLRGFYQGRTAEGRREGLRKFAGGMDDLTERAVLRALVWLKEHQKPDGSWSPQYNEAMTGLALLTFLAHGETPESPEFGPTVQKGIQWLANFMLTKGDAKFTGKGYAHGIATYALCEAYGLTKLPIIKPAMEKGLSRIIRGQQETGGWDYNYAKGERWDLSVSAWQIQALKAGYVAGAQVEGHEQAIAKSIDFLQKVTFKDGKFGYSSPGSGSGGMQGAGTLGLQLLGEGKSSEALAGVRNISSNFEPKWDELAKYAAHNHPSYMWYYQTQAVFHGGQSYFRDWNKVFAPMVIANQKADGHWESPGADNEIGAFDPYYSTTLNALSLQVYYRYLPTYQEPSKIAEAQNLFDVDDEELELDLE